MHDVIKYPGFFWTASLPTTALIISYFRWGKVREEYIGKDKVIVNDIQESETDPFNAAAKPSSFFSVVKEATAVEKKKKERPSLMKFLEKFDSVDLPESVTPNPPHCFSHFEV